MNIELLYSIYRRWKSDQGPTEIARTECIGRATVYTYIKQIEAMSAAAEMVADSPETIRAQLLPLIKGNHKPAPVKSFLEPHKDEIRGLIERKTDPLKAKTAWQVISERYGLAGTVSYETFKRFVRDMGLATPQPVTIRIESEGGVEAQIDYAKVGTRTDPLTGKRSAVQAFIGTLSCSRLPFVQFVKTQCQVSFTESIVAMFCFWGGVTKRLSLDNLKAGVVKADIWDPQLNRTLEAMAAHYDFFIDPCRVASPTEKGKVERLVQPVRELYRRLAELHPHEDLTALNARALRWCTEEYGRRPHGTTGVEPMRVFEELERGSLSPLPVKAFEAPVWTKAKVHPDQYIRVKKKLYSLPARYIGCEVEVRITGTIIDIFHLEQNIRSYTVAIGPRYWVPGDFPEGMDAMMRGSYSGYLIRKAQAEFGEEVAALMRQVLDIPANQTSRRALGILDKLRLHKGAPYLVEVVKTAQRRHIDQPRVIAEMLTKAQATCLSDLLAPRSELGRAMVRDVSQFIN
jgi:transposase